MSIVHSSNLYKSKQIGQSTISTTEWNAKCMKIVHTHMWGGTCKSGKHAPPGLPPPKRATINGKSHRPAGKARPDLECTFPVFWGHIIPTPCLTSARYYSQLIETGNFVDPPSDHRRNCPDRGEWHHKLQVRKLLDSERTGPGLSVVSYSFNLTNQTKHVSDLLWVTTLRRHDIEGES